MTLTRTELQAANTAENPHAGKGHAVILDIGGDIGALIVTMPAAMADLEVEIVPAGSRQRDPAGAVADRHGHPHPHASDHHHDHDHDHDHEHPHIHAAGAPPHVAVVARPLPDGTVTHSLVYDSVPAGRYDLYVRPSGPIRLTATIRGGQVTQLQWPTEGELDTGSR